MPYLAYLGGDLSSESTLRGWYLVEVVEMAYTFSFVALNVFGKFFLNSTNTLYLPVTHCGQQGDMGYL